MLGDLRARAVSTRWESFNRQLSAFRLAYDISGGATAKWPSPSVSPLYRQHVLTLSPAQEAPRARRLRSGMTVLWRRDCEGDCRSWRIATCCFDAVAHDSVTLLRKPMSVSEPSNQGSLLLFWNGKCNHQHCNSRSVRYGT
jgi:hypothetical protein